MNPKASAVLEILADVYPDMEENPPRGDPFRTLIGCILSQRTRDSSSEKAVERLFSHASTPREVVMLDQEELYDLIRCSGFYRQKARYIRETCRELVERHGGEVPDEKEALLRLTGVGPKTADVVLSHCFDEAVIAVDVHVSRVSRRLGLAPMEAGPEKVQLSLHGLIPQDKYLFYDRSTVRLGKGYCRKSNPLCGECPLRGCCDYGKPSTGI